MNNDMDDPNILSLRTEGYLNEEPPEHRELLSENRERPLVEPEPPCAKYMAGLVQELKDLVNAISKSTRAQFETQDLSKLKRAKRLRKHAGITPRFIRLRDAPDYVGMDPNRFNAEARPYLTEIPIGKQGVAFDKIDLDTWVEQYKDRNGRPGKAMKGGKPWDANEHRGSSREAESGTSKRQSPEDALDKALERILSKRPSDT